MIDLESTIRISPTSETLARITPLAWKQFGITRVANITGLDNIGIPVYVSVRPNSKSLSVSQGKGVSDDLAKISAMMESIETWHAENIEPNKIILTGSYGLASGNNYDEALCHSLCELIERDAVACWMQLSESEQDQQLIDLHSINDQTTKLLIEKIIDADLDVYVWNIENIFLKCERSRTRLHRFISVPLIVNFLIP